MPAAEICAFLLLKKAQISAGTGINMGYDGVTRAVFLVFA